VRSRPVSPENPNAAHPLKIEAQKTDFINLNMVASSRTPTANMCRPSFDLWSFTLCPRTV